MDCRSCGPQLNRPVSCIKSSFCRWTSVNSVAPEGSCSTVADSRCKQKVFSMGCKPKATRRSVYATPAIADPYRLPQHGIALSDYPISNYLFGMHPGSSPNGLKCYEQFGANQTVTCNHKRSLGKVQTPLLDYQHQVLLVRVEFVGVAD